MSGRGSLLPLWVNPDMAGAAGTTTSALPNNPADAVIYRYVHHMIPQGPRIGFSTTVRLHKGDGDFVGFQTHHHIILAVEFP